MLSCSAEYTFFTSTLKKNDQILGNKASLNTSQGITIIKITLYQHYIIKIKISN